MSEDEPAVRITLSKIYAELGELKEGLGTLSAQLAPHVVMTKAKQVEYETRLANHGNRLAEAESRLTHLEARQRPRSPWYSIVAGVVGILTGAGLLITLIGVLAQLAEITP